MTLYCATTNPGKLREFRLAAGGSHAAIRIEPVPGLNVIPPPAETGRTFRENAVAKAIYYSRFAPGATFADDSGLVVDALGGAPGVDSAHYAGPGATDDDNNQLLLERLRGIEERAARFVSVIALAEDGRLIGAFEGVVEGWILEAPRGSNGFGYDPLFLYPPYGRTLAEVSPEEKLAVSHRGKALRALLEFVARLSSPSPGARNGG